MGVWGWVLGDGGSEMMNQGWDLRVWGMGVLGMGVGGLGMDDGSWGMGDRGWGWELGDGSL